jgi:NAD(P)H-quinone oxidoreductase subunit 4
MCYIFWQHYDASDASFQIVENSAWMAQLGLNWSVAVDGISVPLVLLAGFVTTVSMFSACLVDRRPRLFSFLMLVLYSAQVGVFLAKDLMLFFIMWEVQLVPIYLYNFHLGWTKKTLRSDKIYIIYRSSFYIYFSSCPGNGFIRWRQY